MAERVQFEIRERSGFHVREFLEKTDDIHGDKVSTRVANDVEDRVDQVVDDTVVKAVRGLVRTRVREVAGC